MRTIRASEIGTYLFCRRAWWYQKNGIESENQAEMTAGNEIHHRHGQAEFESGCLQTAAIVLLLLAVGLLSAYIVELWL